MQFDDARMQTTLAECLKKLAQLEGEDVVGALMKNNAGLLSAQQLVDFAKALEQPPVDKKTIRVTVDLSPARHEALGRLQEDLGAESKADVVREAIRLYAFLASAIRDGAKIYVVKPTGESERLLMIHLEGPG